MPMAEETDRNNVRDSDEFEALRNLYASYRFEIDNLWKRSSILSVFVGLFFVGYGQLALRMLDNLGNEEKLADSAICNALICGIAFVAIVFSVIWIMTAKASKGWQEVYQRKIEEYEDNLLKTDWTYKLANNTGGKDFFDCILSTMPGRFSVSRINTLIGIVLFWIWLSILVVHLFIVRIIACDENVLYYLPVAANKLLFIVLIVIIVWLLPRSLRSSKLGRNNIIENNKHTRYSAVGRRNGICILWRFGGSRFTNQY